MAAYLLNLAAVTAIGNAIAFEDEVMLARVVRQAKELYIKALAPNFPKTNDEAASGSPLDDPAPE
jgi:hypothetical protein